MTSTFISLFCGFMIKPSDFPTFWVFMYWLDPLHYALEGLIVTQFNRDSTVISITGTQFSTTASAYVEAFYSDWDYRHRGLDVLALLLFIVFLRYVHFSSVRDLCMSLTPVAHICVVTGSARTWRSSTCAMISAEWNTGTSMSGSILFFEGYSLRTFGLLDFKQ